MQHITVYTMTHRQKGLDEVHARFLSLLAHLLRPDASLDLTNVSLMKQYHTDGSDRYRHQCSEATCRSEAADGSKASLYPPCPPA